MAESQGRRIMRARKMHGGSRDVNGNRPGEENANESGGGRAAIFARNVATRFRSRKIGRSAMVRAMKMSLPAALAMFLFTAAACAEEVDVFGTKKHCPTIPGGREWASKWATGAVRAITNMKRDPQDAEFIVRGNGSVTIDGKGVATMTGDSPRMYVYDEPRAKTWNNVEVTFYMLRVSEAKVLTYQGMAVGTRSEHQDVEVNGNVGRTYYAKFAYDGRAFFIKETDHHTKGGYHDSTELKHFPKGFPKEKWIGMKFVCRTRGQTVKLEQYEDTTDGAKGGHWVKVAEITDDGKWAEKPYLAAQPSTFIRNDGLGEARYKKWTIREIAPLGQ